MPMQRLATLISAGVLLGALTTTVRADVHSYAPHWAPRFADLGMDGAVTALGVFDDGTGTAFYAGGAFTTAGGTAVNGIARLAGDQWVPLGSGISDFNGSVWAMMEFNDGTGPALYIVGDFLEVGGQVVNRIARWDGSAWSDVGGGTNGPIRGALTVFDDGSGPALYVGGDFTMAGAVETNHIAKWDGEQWSALGSGTSGQFSSVRALVVFDDGNGPALYAGGNFAVAGDIAVNGIAGWDGQQWSAVGGGVGHETPGSRLVRGLAVFDDGSGPALYATGQFATAGGVPAPCIARWDGQSWSAVGDGLSSEPGSIPTGRRLTVLDDGAGPALYVGGTFTIAAGETVNYIAKWDGGSWSSLGSGMNSTVYCLATFDEGDGPALFAGGQFTTAGGVTSLRIAKWATACVGDFDSDADGDVDVLDASDFAACMTGPAVAVPADCQIVHDADCDLDVDLEDFAGLQAMFTGNVLRH